MRILTWVIGFTATALVLAVVFCAVLLTGHQKTSCGPTQPPCPAVANCNAFSANTVLPCQGWTRIVPQPPADSRNATNGNATHGCAVFGGTVPSCQNYPDWTTGTWVAPAGVYIAQVLLVGGGGAGGASPGAGRGGGGGGAGQIFAGAATLSAGPIPIYIGTGGMQERDFYPQAGFGAPSYFGNIRASGGFGAQAIGNGGFGSSGGGGGGTYEEDFVPNAGGAGGADGSAGGGNGDINHVLPGSYGGQGIAYPPFDFFKSISISPGPGGAGCSGGGGGGGILVSGAGPSAMDGENAGPANLPCQGAEGLSGHGGIGYGAGGGGGGNLTLGTPGGDGAPGIVYIEW